MNETRRAYLEAFETTRSLVASPQLARKWNDPSVLADFSIRGLAGHLCRAGQAVLDYLDRDLPADASPIEAERYFATVLGFMGPVEHEQVRVRGEDNAGPDAASLLAKRDAAQATLEDRLEQEPDDRLVYVFGELVMYLDDYLVARIIEILVHNDDLALSLGVDTPTPPDAAMELALDHLLRVARLMHGDAAVLTAFSRRERDAVNALRVF